MNNLPCDAFRRNPNKSWTVTGSASIEGENQKLRLPMNATFKRGDPVLGIDVAAWLDEHCAADADSEE